MAQDQERSAHASEFFEGNVAYYPPEYAITGENYAFPDAAPWQNKPTLLHEVFEALRYLTLNNMMVTGYWPDALKMIRGGYDATTGQSNDLVESDVIRQDDLFRLRYSRVMKFDYLGSRHYSVLDKSVYEQWIRIDAI